MKLFKKIVAVVMAVAMLTACGGSGGGGGTGGGGTPVAPSTFSSTKTYKLAQSGKGKSLYMEFWEAYTDNGQLIQEKDAIMKEGSTGKNVYGDLYEKGVLTTTMISNNGISYVIFYAGSEGYDQYAEVAVMGGAEIPEGKNIYINANIVNQALSGKSSRTGNVTGGNANAGVADPGNLNESKVTVETGTYTMPGTSVKYYAEIFTSKANPKQSITYAYDNNDELKAVVEVNGDRTDAMFFNKFEYDSPEFKAAKLNILNYDAMDITAAYIAGVKKIQQGIYE